VSTAQHAKAPTRTTAALGPRYKWIALSNTTLGMLMATINSSIVLIALPDIFKGIGINPLSPDNTSYLLWMMMGFLVVTAVLVVSFGRLGDMYGRVKMYNMGFAIFAISSILLSVTWFDGPNAALWLIGWRVVQGIGGAFLMANSSAILTDAFPANQRGTALGLNAVAAIAGSFLGLVLGGVLAPVDWHLVFIVSAPFGVFGSICICFLGCSYLLEFLCAPQGATVHHQAGIFPTESDPADTENGVEVGQDRQSAEFTDNHRMVGCGACCDA